MIVPPKVFHRTHKGLKRSVNQDSVLVNQDLGLFAVADGMGGHKGGEVASATAISALNTFISEALKKPDFLPETHSIEGFRAANKEVFEKSRANNGELMGMGTTLVSCLLWKGRAYFTNVGDSRAYLFRTPRLWRITEDHSIVNMQLKKGLITEENVKLLPEGNVITRSIGFISEVEADFFQKDIAPGDLFLLCSDGLNEIPERELARMLLSTAPENFASAALQKTLDCGGHDNISFIVIAFPKNKEKHA